MRQTGIVIGAGGLYSYFKGFIDEVPYAHIIIIYANSNRIHFPKHAIHKLYDNSFGYIIYFFSFPALDNFFDLKALFFRAKTDLLNTSLNAKYSFIYPSLCIFYPSVHKSICKCIRLSSICLSVCLFGLIHIL